MGDTETTGWLEGAEAEGEEGGNNAFRGEEDVEDGGWAVVVVVVVVAVVPVGVGLEEKKGGIEGSLFVEARSKTATRERIGLEREWCNDQRES